MSRLAVELKPLIEYRAVTMLMYCNAFWRTLDENAKQWLKNVTGDDMEIQVVL